MTRLIGGLFGIYIMVALVCTDLGTIIGVDDVLLAICAGYSFDKSGWFRKKDGPLWMNRIPRIRSLSRSTAKSSDSAHSLNPLPNFAILGNFLWRQKEDDEESEEGGGTLVYHQAVLSQVRDIFGTKREQRRNS